MSQARTESRPTILVTGATGQVGGATIRALADDPNIRVVAGARVPEKARHVLPDGIDVVRFDLNSPATMAAALSGVDRALLVTGYTVEMLRQSKSFVDQAKAAHVQHIVHLGACGIDDTTVGHWAWHQLIERYIEWAGVSFTHLRPEWFMQNMVGYGGSKPVQDGVIHQFVGDAVVSWVDCNDVAAVAAEALRNPQIHAGHVYRLGYDAKSFTELASLMSDVVGKPFRYQAQSPDIFLEAVKTAGADMAYMSCVYEHYKLYAAHAIPGSSDVFDDFESITSRKPVLWREFIEKHRSRFAY